MSFQRIVNFAKFLKFPFIEGNFSDGQIFKNEKYYSQINNENEEQKIRDLTHELAHYLIANEEDYKKKNFGLGLPGYYPSPKPKNFDNDLDETACVLGCIIMNYFNIDSDIIYKELIHDYFRSQEKEIDVAVKKLIEKGIIKYQSKQNHSTTYIKKCKIHYISKSKMSSLPEYFLIPKIFNIPQKILRRIS